MAASTPTDKKPLLKNKFGAFVQVPREIVFAKYLSLASYRLFSYFLSMPSANPNEDEHCTAFPSYETIREKIGLNFNVIAKSVRELEHHGWVIREKRFGSTPIYSLQPGAENPSQSSRIVSVLRMSVLRKRKK